jgi:Histidine kinase-, DNA gyrase B-, and HSP90-like ATPase
LEGPYRDLGAGFARLMGVEGARRTPSRIAHVEDALLELLRNSGDAGATRIYVASTLRDRRYRTLTVIDDGHGIPESHRDLILEPGVTTRHLDPVFDPHDPSPHGAGLSLYQIETRSLTTKVLSASSPTAIQATFDTTTLPERALQSTTRPSNTNLRATLERFLAEANARRNGPTLQAYYGPPARILATLLDHRIIQTKRESGPLREVAAGLGLGVSVRSVQRIVRGEVLPLDGVSGGGGAGDGAKRRILRGEPGGPVLALGEEESAGIADILRRAARAGYLEVEDLRFESRPGEISVSARVYEPEDEYE